MKQVYRIFGIFLILCLLLSCSNKSKSAADDIDTLSCVDEIEVDGIIDLEKSVCSDTTTWNGHVFKYIITRESDRSLPLVTETETGRVYSDNKVELQIFKNGVEMYRNMFTKMSFSNYLDTDTKKNGILEGLVFDKINAKGITFATSVSYPLSDMYIPLLVTVGYDGSVAIQRDNIMEEEAMMDELEE